MGCPAKWRVAFAMKRSTEFCTASGDQPATCGVSTTLDRPMSSAGGAGSLSYTAGAAPGRGAAKQQTARAVRLRGARGLVEG